MQNTFNCCGNCTHKETKDKYRCKLSGKEVLNYTSCIQHKYDNFAATTTSGGVSLHGRRI